MTLTELRKPILITAITVFFALLLHLIGVYVYEGGEPIGVPGGSISIGIVGESPNIPNPLEYGQGKYSDLILKFMFRSVIRYDAKLGEYTADIGSCDIRDLSKIHCELKKQQLWSDGTTIQIEDIIATYKAFQANPGSEKMRAFLNGVTITSKDKNSVDLTSKEKNSLMLDLLTYPIIRSDMLERIRTGRLASDGYVTSGPYVFLEKDTNTQYGYDRITITRNTKNGGEGWLDKYHFLFFPDFPSLERSIDTVSVIIPPAKNEIIPVGPRFAPYQYSFYEFIGLFQNTDSIHSDIRKPLALAFSSSFSGQIAEHERPIRNIFGDQYLLPPEKVTRDLADVMRERRYMKIAERISLLDTTNIVLTGASIQYGTTNFFTLPGKQKVLFSEIAEGSILLTGNVPTSAQSVFINGYELKEFIPGNAKFSYRVALENQALKEGKNTYTLETLDTNGKREVRETLTIYYAQDGLKLKTMREQVEQEYLAKLNTPELVAERQKGIQDKKTKLNALDPRYYYNDALEPFELTVAHAGEPASLVNYAKQAETTLTHLGIKSTIRPISTKDLQSMLQKGKKDYDIILIGFEATGRVSRVGQVFLSSEAKNGINFAKIQSKQLDSLFAQLRTATEKNITEETIKKIVTYFQEGAFFTPISSPIHTLYIDRNLKGIIPIDIFQDITTLHTTLARASIKEEYLIHTDGKGITHFIRWVIQNFSPGNN